MYCKVCGGGDLSPNGPLLSDEDLELSNGLFEYVELWTCKNCASTCAYIVDFETLELEPY